MNQRRPFHSARAKARLAGVFYLLNMATAIFGMFGSNKLVDYANAAITAQNIAAHTSFWRITLASDILANVCYLVITALLYRLLKPVSRTVSLCAALCSITGCAVGAVGAIFHLAPLVLLGDSPFLTAFTPAQLQALVLLSIKLHARILDVSIIFFGFYCILLGYLIFRSTFLPRAIGLLVALSGLGWLTYLWPPLASSLSSVLILTGLAGEGSVALWLTVVGLNPEKWSELAHTSAPTSSLI